jgi:2-methylisocitrate lyase-like PEP mutase family enzyme
MSPPIEQTTTFRALHAAGTFVMPNPWDVGTARYLETRGFPALATTSAGLAASFGRNDLSVTLDELLAHVEAITTAVSVPVNVDSERLYADDTDGVARSVALLASAGAAGCSIEDYDPAVQEFDPVERAAERVAAAADEARRHGLVLTGRAENHLRGADDLDDTIGRLIAYRDAGAEVVFAPGLTRPDDIARVVAEVQAPVNVLTMPGGCSVPELADLGVRRVSTGAALTLAAYRGLAAAVDELSGPGTMGFTTGEPSWSDIAAAFA